MKLKVLLLIASGMLSTGTANADNLFRSDISDKTKMLIPAMSPTSLESTRIPQVQTFTIGSGQFTIPEGTVTFGNGNVLNSNQVVRLQSIIDNDMYEYLGIVYAATPSLLHWFNAANPSEQQTFDLPESLATEQCAVVTYQPASYSGDTDSARFMFRGVTDAVYSNLLDTGYINWSSNGYPESGVLRTGGVIVPTGTKQLNFFGACKRVSGTSCSARIHQAYATFNPDLPAAGDTITVTQ